jgi:hypothetical protein
MRLFVMIPLLGICDLLWWLWADRRVRRTRRPRMWRSLLAAFILVQVVCLHWWMYQPGTVRSIVGLVPTPVLASVYIWHLLLLPVAITLAIGDTAVRGVMILWRRSRRSVVTIPSSSGASGPTRRDLLGSALAAASPILLTGSVGRGMSQFGEVRVRPFNLSFAELPEALDGLTIAHVTDIHVGRFSTTKGLANLVETVNQLRADLVLLTGDLIDFAISDLPAALDVVKRMDARHGLAMCLGNHDLIDDPYRFVTDVRKAGVPLLIGGQRRIRIGSSAVQLMGLDWIRSDADQKAGVGALPRRQPDAFPILMAHHPHAFDAAATAGLPLTLSGHTHGGLLMLNDHFGAGSVMFRYWSGLYRRGGSSLIVSNGVGTWFPLRVNAPAEIVHVTLRRA